MSAGPLVSAVLRWYGTSARDLPWRRPETDPWQVMVSEFMLQQTPVSRVLAPWQEWVGRWPTPTSLAASSAGDAVRAWGRLGYPRRALRLHAAAGAITDRYGGEVPRDREALLGLPGVGSYTAAAILTFAYGQRHVVLDTNVRRVLSRVAAGVDLPGPTITRTEVVLARSLLPRTAPRAARWAAASMELGAMVCTARGPRCTDCPVRRRCAWRAAGSPPGAAVARPSQRYEGTDRQCRGSILALLRTTAEAVPLTHLVAAWPDHTQRQRALDSLVADGLVVPGTDGTVALPS